MLNPFVLLTGKISMINKKTASFLILISSIFGLLTILPLIKHGFSSAYFIIDPEAVYIGNAISYIKSHIIYYAEHPGTPTILMLAFSYWPFRIYAKLVEHQAFMLWFLNNIDLVFFYSRLLSFVVFVSSLFIFSVSIFRLTKSILSAIFFELAIMSFSFMPRLGSEIIPETLSFFITAVWAFFFSKFVLSRSFLKILILSFISGVAVANKFTNITLILISMALIFLLYKKLWKEKLTCLALSMIGFVGGFILFTWPVRQIYSIIFNWVYQIINHTGVWGGGEVGFFNWGLYIETFRNLVNSNRVGIAIVLMPILFGVYIVFIKKVKLNPILLIANFLSLLTILVFMKFPRIHYILVPYTIVVFIGSIIVNKLPKLLKVLSIIILIYFFIGNIKEYFSFIDSNIEDSIKLQTYITNNPSKKATLWDYGRVKDFVYIWMRDWTQGIFTEELKVIRPDLLELEPNYETVLLDFNTSVDVFDACWDNLYIRTDRGKIFLERHSNREFISEPVDRADIMVIKSNHCK